MARLRYLQNKRSGAAGTISKATNRIYFYDDNAYIYAASSGVLHIVATTINLDGAFAFTGTDKLLLGSSTANLTLTEGTPVFQVYTNCSSSHASTTAVPSYFCANMDTAAGVGRALEAVLTVEDVKLGSWSNAIKGKIDFETSGSGSGLLSAICAEMIMPAATMGGYGNYAPLEIEFVCPLTWAGTPQSVSFMNINLAAGSTGDTTGNFDDIGYLMVINGLDDDTTQLLYNNTLKMKVGTTTWYLPMSSAQSSYTTDQSIVSTYTTAAAIQLGTTGKIQFHDTGMYIHAASDGNLDIVSDTNVNLTGKFLRTETGLTCLNAGTTGRRSYWQFTAISFETSEQLCGLQLRSNFAGTQDYTANGITGIEIKARANDTSITHRIGTAKAIIANCDAKKATFDVAWGVESQFDIGSGGTISRGAAFRASLNNSGTLTAGYAYLVETANTSYNWDYGFYCTDGQADTGIAIGTCSTVGISMTALKGISCTATFVPDSGYTNYAYSVGNKAAELDITFANDSDQNMNPIQAVINCIPTSTGPTNSSQINVFRAHLTHDTNPMTNLRLKCADFYTEVGANVLDAYCYQGEVELTGSVAIGGQACVMGLVMKAGTGTVTGSAVGVYVAMDGASMPSESYGIFMASGASATLTNGIYIETQGGTTITYGLNIANGTGGTFTNAMRLAGTITNFLNLNNAGNSGFVTTGGSDCTASGETDPGYTIKCIMPDGGAGYIRVWDSA